MRQLLYYIKAFHVCQQLFYFFVLHLKLSFLMHQLVYNNIRFPECQALFSTFFTFS